MALPNHPAHSLAGIALPRGVVWPNRYQRQFIGQQLIRMLNGSIDQYAQANNGIGQPVTLQIALPASYLSQSQYDALQTKADVVGASYTLAWGDYSSVWSTTDYTVIFDFQQGAAIDVQRQIVRLSSAAGALTPIYTGQINLLRIA